MNKNYGLSEKPTSNEKYKIPDWLETALLDMEKNPKEHENPFKDCKNFYEKFNNEE